MKKTPTERFLASNVTIEKLGHGYVLCPKHLDELERWFDHYPDVRKGRYWFLTLARWISLDMGDFVERRRKIEEIGIYRNNLDSFILRYGEIVGREEYEKFREVRGRNSVFRDSDFQREMASRSVAKQKLEGDHYRNARSVKHHTAKGLTEEEARKRVSAIQRRDLAFFVSKYGESEGAERFAASKDKRMKTWETKDRRDHAAKTAPKSSKLGQEFEAILGFVEHNGFCSDDYTLVCGPPSDQFSVTIPEVGIRRYDLAIFKEQQLHCVVEYHGPCHVNFSDYRDELRDELVTDRKTGKPLPYGKTYGQMVENDRIKRNYIEENYPSVIYVVIWTEDLMRKDFDIDRLQKPRAARVS